MRAPESELLTRLLYAALAAADPVRCLPPFLPTTRPVGRTVVLGAGKAAASMAVALADHHEAHDLGPLGGVVVTRYGHGLKPGEQTGGIRVLEAGHPVPDTASEFAGSQILEAARSCRPGDRCIVLLSGGASALMVQPAVGLTLADKQAVSAQLLNSGATIAEINAVRRKLSAIKGGGLARNIRTKDILLFAISDVAGDVLADIGSGPLSADRVSNVEAGAILQRYRVATPASVGQLLRQPWPPASKPEAGVPAGITACIVASSATAVTAAAEAAAAAGWATCRLPEAYGPAQEVAVAHADLVRKHRVPDQSRDRPVVLISGGETTTCVREASGRGGRNGEYLLALAIALGREGGVHALAADTDGIDGNGDSAGAMLTPDTLQRAGSLGLNAAFHLQQQCSHDFFAELGDLVTTGPTRTNVNDLRIILAR